MPYLFYLISFIEDKNLKPRIVLVKIGEIESNLLERLREELSVIFYPLRVEISGILPIPKEAYNFSRQQYNSSHFLEALKIYATNKNSKILGITPVDLYTKGLNFIFGQATLEGNVCVISIHRLRSEFYGQAKDEKIFIERCTKEAVHELGHTFFLNHCPNPRCVMHFSNHILDTDRKSKNFCEKCQSKINEKIKSLEV